MIVCSALYLFCLKGYARVSWHVFLTYIKLSYSFKMLKPLYNFLSQGSRLRLEGLLLPHPPPFEEPFIRMTSFYDEKVMRWGTGIHVLQGTVLSYVNIFARRFALCLLIPCYAIPVNGLCSTYLIFCEADPYLSCSAKQIHARPSSLWWNLPLRF